MKLKELCKIKHGFAFKGKDIIKNYSTKYVLVTPGNFNIGGGFKKDKCKYFSENGNIPKDYILRENDLIVTMTDLSVKSDTLGYSALIPKDNNIYLHNQRIGLVHDIDESKVLKDYLYWFMRTKKYQQEVVASQSGTAIHHTSPDRILNIEIDLPSIDNQRKIVKILSDVEHKIKNNNDTNNNLHDLCNNLYFRLVSQLNDTNSSVESIKNVAKCVLGGTPSRIKKEYWNGSINWINSGEINKFRIIKASEKITELGLNKSSTTLLPRGTTVLAITGATLGQVSRLEIDSCANQSVIGIITNKKELNNYMYLSILNSINDVVLKKTGGAQQHINKNDVETHEIIVPSTELISQFDEIIRPLFDQISVNCFEINKLEQLRDTLLPKLMNDEIDLDNIEI